EKGAFTGADHRKTGLFELAHQGTLFLDEIGDMEKDMQKKLLRVLQEKNFRRVGGRETISVDVRIISATNADLEKLIEQSRFREDLYYRIKVMTIHLPPLRQRREDIPLLVKSFIQKIAEEQGTEPKEIHPDAMRVMTAYSWPGNIRELKNEIQRLVLVSGGIIGPESVRDLVNDAGRAGAETGGFSGKTMEQIEREVIMEALRETGNNKALAARVLGMPRRTLYNRLKKYGIMGFDPAISDDA
ncbi:MAG: sigma-54 dependent transcriptional regulator, partial [Planctomycetota bacterium]